MDNHLSVCQQIFTFLAYISSAAAVVMGFFNTYAAGIGAICAVITVVINYRFQRVRLEIDKKKSHEIDG